MQTDGLFVFKSEYDIYDSTILWSHLILLCDSNSLLKQRLFRLFNSNNRLKYWNGTCLSIRTMLPCVGSAKLFKTFNPINWFSFLVRLFWSWTQWCIYNGNMHSLRRKNYFCAMWILLRATRGAGSDLFFIMLSMINKTLSTLSGSRGRIGPLHLLLSYLSKYEKHVLCGRAMGRDNSWEASNGNNLCTVQLSSAQI